MPAASASPGAEKTCGTPCSSTLPSSGPSAPPSIAASVDLPAPFSPTIACTVPARSATVTSRSAVTRPKRWVMPRAASTGTAAPAAPTAMSRVSSTLTEFLGDELLVAQWRRQPQVVDAVGPVPLVEARLVEERHLDVDERGHGLPRQDRHGCVQARRRVRRRVADRDEGETLLAGEPEETV